jgi:hypothetical protein
LIDESIASNVEMSLALSHGGLEAVHHDQKGDKFLCEEYTYTSLQIECKEGVKQD